MSIALFDTNAISDLMQNHRTLKARVSKHSGVITTSVVVIGEIRYGLDRLPIGKKRSDLEALAQGILAALVVEPIIEKAANCYGSIKATLESKGLILDDNDLWIAATAISNGSILVTHDQAFLQVPGLIVEDWRA